MLFAQTAIDWQPFFFMLFATVACVFALGVLFSSNVVRMAFYLTLSLGATAGLFILAGAEFVGAMQLMIYVGGTLVLLIFGVMLTAQKRFVTMQTRGGDWVLALLVGSGLLFLLLNAAFNVPTWREANEHAAKLQVEDNDSAAAIGMAFAGVRVDQLDDPRAAGLSGYLLPFVIVSIHLLVVLVGAGYMARTKRVTDSPATQAAAAAARRERSLDPFVVAFAVIHMIGSLKMAVMHWMVQPSWRPSWESQLGGLTSFYQQNVEGLFNDTIDFWVQRNPNVLWILGVLFLLNIPLLLVLLRFQKWGFVGLCLLPLIQAIYLWYSEISAPGMMGAMLIPGFLVTTLLPVGVMYVLLRRRSPSMWSQLD